MPTGYTAIIGEGADFKRFVWSCARGMGALIDMRDMPSDAPIPDRFEVSSYHPERIVELEAKLVELDATDMVEFKRKIDEKYTIEVANAAERRGRDAELLAKYEAMLAKVEAWTPPTEDHNEFKEFMIQQIQSSIDFDCNSRYDYSPKPPDCSPIAVLFVERRQSILKEIEYHKTKHQEELQRNEERNQWVKALRDSLADI